MFQSILKEDATSSNKLALGNSESRVAIVTLWSKVKEMEKKIEPSRYAVMGQLFSAERGLDPLMRNLLANPQITNILVTGADFSKSGIVLEDFFKVGFEKGETKLTQKSVWRVKSKYEGYLGIDLPFETLEKLRQSIYITRVSDIRTVDFDALPRPPTTREKQVFVPPPEEPIKSYIGEYTGHVVRGKTIAEAWLGVLDSILKFGRQSGTHYSEPQREILNLLSIIEEEDPHNFFIPDYLPCNEERVRSYIPRITRDIPGGIHKNEYTYGSRMRSWFGTDQIKRAVDKLSREPISRAVVIGLWDATKDLEIGGSPCLNHIWFRISEDTLHMTSIFRSHDMFEGYPENAFGLRTLQEEVRAALQERLGKPIGLGQLMILSQSAHLYKDTWEWAQNIVKKHLPPFRRTLSRLDPRGNFIISLKDGEIVMEHTGPAGEKIGEFRGKSGQDIREILVRENVISLLSHSLDIGMELKKAEIAKKLGIPYIQDQPLQLPAAEKPAPVMAITDPGLPAESPHEKSAIREKPIMAIADPSLPADSPHVKPAIQEKPIMAIADPSLPAESPHAISPFPRNPINAVADPALLATSPHIEKPAPKNPINAVANPALSSYSPDAYNQATGKPIMAMAKPASQSQQEKPTLIFSTKRVLKEGIRLAEHHKKAYPRILQDAHMYSMTTY